MSRGQNSGLSDNIKIGNSSHERKEQFKYLGKTWANQNSFKEEIKSSLKSGNICYHSVQNLSSSNLLSNNLKIKVYRTIILRLLFCMCVKPGRSHWGRNVCWGSFRTACWGEYFWLRRDEVTGEWRKLHNEELNDLYCSPSIVRVIKSRRRR